MSSEFFLKVALNAAELASQKIATAWEHSEVVIEEAHIHDFKIQLDKDVQTLIESIILRHFPSHAILGEEGECLNEASPFQWIVDPIDGTANFTYGIPHFCISIACQHNGKTILGVIADPIRKEIFTAVEKGGSKKNGKPIYVSKRATLAEAALAFGFGNEIEHGLKLYSYYGPRACKVRSMGSVSLNMAYLACGRIDGFIQNGVHIWDVAAGQLLIEEAGGKVTLTPLEKKHKYHICATNGLLVIEPPNIVQIE